MAIEIEGTEPEITKPEKKKEDRPLMKVKTEKLKEIMEKHRDLLSEAFTKEDKEFHKAKILEIETELRQR